MRSNKRTAVRYADSSERFGAQLTRLELTQLANVRCCSFPTSLCVSLVELRLRLKIVPQGCQPCVWIIPSDGIVVTPRQRGRQVMSWLKASVPVIVSCSATLRQTRVVQNELRHLILEASSCSLTSTILGSGIYYIFSK